MARFTRDDIKQWLTQWLRENEFISEQGEVEETSHLERDLELDSIEAVDLELAAKEHFSIEISDEESSVIFQSIPNDSENKGTVGAVIDLIMRKL